jgi:aminopeptidase
MHNYMMDTFLIDKLANLLVNYSTEVKSGDKVSIKAEDIAIPFIIAVAKAAVRAGGFVDYSVTLPEVEEIILEHGDEKQLQQPNGHYGYAVKESDVWITAWGSKNARLFSNVAPSLLKKRRLANAEERNIYSKRTGSGELRWVGTLFPVAAEAQEASMSTLEFQKLVYQAGMLHKDDPIAEWLKIDKEQQVWVDYLNKKNELRIVVEDTDIVVGIEGRKWINCCGKMNFPDGEIFTSPIENKINGIISFDYPAIYSGRMVTGVKLKVKDGLIIDATANTGEEFLHTCIETDDGSKYFGEVAIGTNYNLTKFTKNILLDEKIGGTIHMAIGASMLEAGGKNNSAIHWDMIRSMKNEGRIFADGELFYANGRFIKNVLMN